MTVISPPSSALPAHEVSPTSKSTPPQQFGGMDSSSGQAIPDSPRSPSGSAPLIPSTTGNRRIFVTGSAGFIGFHTCVALLERGDDVVVVDELNDYYDVKLKQSNLDYLVSQFTSDRVKIYIGDLCDQALVRKVIRDTRPEAIIHLAARAGVRPSIDDPLLYIHSNVTAATVLLEACRRFRITKFVYASSSSVYGGSTKGFFSEQDTVDFPVSPYAATKKSCELLAHTYHHLYRIECVGLRFFTVYGPRGRPDMAPFKFMDRITRGISIDQYGDGSSSRDYTYIDDIVQGVLLSLDKVRGCEMFNLGRGTPTNLMDFISIIEGLVGKKAQINILPMQPGDVPRTCADISKAKRLLGYEPMTPLSEGLEKTWAWYRTFYKIQSDDSSSAHDKSQRQRN
ncbi:Pumilio 23, partial [Globisporangium splendens]